MSTCRTVPENVRPPPYHHYNNQHCTSSVAQEAAIGEWTENHSVQRALEHEHDPRPKSPKPGQIGMAGKSDTSSTFSHTHRGAMLAAISCMHAGPLIRSVEHPQAARPQ